MKKTDIALIAGVILIILIALLIGNNKNNNDIELPLVLAGDVGFNEITYDEYEKHIENDDAFLVVVVQTGCTHCQNFEPIVEQVAGEYQIPILKLNITNLEENDYYALKDSNRYLKTKKWGTPTTLLMKGSTVVDSIGGEETYEEFVKFIKENVKYD